MDKTMRFKVFAALMIAIVPTIGFCFAAKPRPKPKPKTRPQAARPTVDRSAFDELEKEGQAIRRSMSDDKWITGVRPASTQPICTSVVTDLYAYGVTVGSNEVVHATFGWACQAAGQNPCQVVEVRIITYIPTGASIVDHVDLSLQCGGESNPVNYCTFTPVSGEYQITVDIYPGPWATWTPSTPLLDGYTFYYTH